MRNGIVIVLAGAALFVVGRRLNADRDTTPPPASSVRGHDSPALATAALGSAIRKLGLSAGERQLLAETQLGREARNTVREPDGHRDARRKYLSSEIERLDSVLAPAKREQMLALNDRNEAEFRQYRADFVLGNLTEDEYIASLKDMVRRGVDDAKAFLSRDEFVVLEGNPDYDPFDPRAHSVPGGPQYVSADEEAALAKNAESSTTGPPDWSRR